MSRGWDAWGRRGRCGSLHHICTARLAFLPHTDKTSHRGPARQAAPAPRSSASPLKPIIFPRVPSSRRRRARTCPSSSRCSCCLTTSSTRPSPNPVTIRDRGPTSRTARESPPAARSLPPAPRPCPEPPGALAASTPPAPARRIRSLRDRMEQIAAPGLVDHPRHGHATAASRCRPPHEPPRTPVQPPTADSSVWFPLHHPRLAAPAPTCPSRQPWLLQQAAPRQPDLLSTQLLLAPASALLDPRHPAPAHHSLQHAMPPPSCPHPASPSREQ